MTDTVAVDREQWGRFLYLLIREHALIESRAQLPDWSALTPKQRGGWVSDASEFIRGYEQKREQVESTLAQAVRREHGERIAKDHDEQADEYERLGYLGEDIYRACARRARDLSPPP